MLTLLKFKAEWCGPCKNMAPIVQQLDEQDDKLIVQDVDIDDNPQLRAEYGIRSIPSFVLLKDRKMIAQKTGSCTLSELKAFVDEHRGL